MEFRQQIESSFGEPLVWDRMDDKKSSKVAFYKPGYNYFNPDEWGAIIIIIIEHLNQLQKATKPFLKDIKNALTLSLSELSDVAEEELS